MKIQFNFVIKGIILLLLVLANPAYAELNFDFGLTLFGQEEVRFEQSKSADFNFQLLQKYLKEREENTLNSLHVIVRWFSLIKLSDAPRKEELMRLSDGYLITSGAEYTKLDRIKEVFYRGIKLSNDKDEDIECLKDQEFEDFLLDSEELLAKSGDYWIIKGILFHELQKRPSKYFSLMKPEEDLKQALVLIPKTAQYYYVMGQAFRYLASTDSPLFLAIASYEKSSSLAPRNARLQNSLLSIYMGLHEEMRAKGKPEPFWLEEVVYKKIIDLSPNNAHALNNLGFLYAEYGVNSKLAQELCQKAVYLAPDNPIFRDSLGWAAFRNGDFHAAEVELKKALQLKPDFYEGHYHLATLYYSMVQYERAARHYEEAIKLNPTASEALNNLAYLYAEQGINSERSLELAKKANILEPNNASYLDTLGWAFYRVGKYRDALDFLLKADELVPGQGEILLHIGRVYLDCDKFTPALRYLKEAFKVEPTLKDPDNSLYLAIQLHSMHTALANYHNMLRERVDAEKVHKMLVNIAQLYQEEKLYEKAIEITKVCVDFKAGKLELDKPILASYILAPLKEKEIEEKKKEIAAEKKDSDEKKEELLEKSHAEKLLGKKMPLDAGYSFIISLGPKLFEYFTPLASFLGDYYDKSITIYAKNLKRIRKNAVIKIESADTSGMLMLKYLRRYLMVMGGACKGDINSDKLEFRFGNKKYFLLAYENKIYLTRRGFLNADKREKIDKIFSQDKDSFLELYLNWNNMKKNSPRWVRWFLYNPIAPFVESHTSFSMRDETLNASTVSTTGKKESNEFFKKYARELFVLKLTTKKYGLDTLIKLSSEDELIYTYIDYIGLDSWLVKYFDKKYSSLNILLKQIIQRNISKVLCFMNRAFFAPVETICPSGGRIIFDEYYGIVSCETHKGSPVVPLVLSEKQMCRLTRELLLNTYKLEELEELFEDPQRLKEVLKKMDLEADCSGEWKWSEYKIICPLHKN